MLLLPMLGMIFLTFGVMMWMLKLRYQAIREDGLNPNYFKLYRGAKLPDYLAKVTQNYENLLEMPILFYIAMILLLVLRVNDSLFVILAWGFLVSRLIHTYIHTHSNKVTYRKNVFITSCFILVAIWVKISISVMTHP